MSCGICGKHHFLNTDTPTGLMICGPCSNRLAQTPESEKRAYWLREFAGRAMQGVITSPGVLGLGGRLNAKVCVDNAEALLAEIERREKEGK